MNELQSIVPIAYDIDYSGKNIIAPNVITVEDTQQPQPVIHIR